MLYLFPTLLALDLVVLIAPQSTTSQGDPLRRLDSFQMPVGKAAEVEASVFPFHTTQKGHRRHWHVDTMRLFVFPVHEDLVPARACRPLVPSRFLVLAFVEAIRPSLGVVGTRRIDRLPPSAGPVSTSPDLASQRLASLTAVRRPSFVVVVHASRWVRKTTRWDCDPRDRAHGMPWWIGSLMKG